jgi:hypothetical protein
MEWVFNALDLESNMEQLKRSADQCSNLFFSFLLFAGASGMTTVFGVLSWHFDVLPTVNWTATHTKAITDQITASVANTELGGVVIASALFTTCLTHAPTVVELLLPRLQHIKPVQWVLFFCILFDFITDWNNAGAFVAQFSFWASAGVFRGAAQWAGTAAMTFVASLVFEHVTVLMGAMALYSGLRSWDLMQRQKGKAMAR